MPKSKKPRPQTLIVSPDKSPKVALKPGMSLEVATVRLLDPRLRKPGRLAARLCGGTSTCITLIELPGDGGNP